MKLTDAECKLVNRIRALKDGKFVIEKRQGEVLGIYIHPSEQKNIDKEAEHK